MAHQFPWIPSYGSAVTNKPNVTQTKFGDGYELRVPIGINTNPRKWQVTFANRPNETADEIGAFLDARGGVEAFDWTPPHWKTANGMPTSGIIPPQAKSGKWVCREWSEQQTGPYTRTITATFEEVFEV